jgi:hypothetical protein
VLLNYGGILTVARGASLSQCVDSQQFPHAMRDNLSKATNDSGNDSWYILIPSPYLLLQNAKHLITDASWRRMSVSGFVFNNVFTTSLLG